MDIKLNNTSDTITVSDAVFSTGFNEALVHQVVTAYLSSGRSGTKAQKTRSEVSGGGSKPWKQKGSGRARAGTIRSPIWKGGGVTFAAKNRDYSQKVNRKMYRIALRGIFSELQRSNQLSIIENFDLTSGKTKDFIDFSRKNNFGSNFLLITETLNEKIFLASRNIPTVSVIDVKAINPISLLRHKRVIIEKSAIEKINEWLS